MLRRRNLQDISEYEGDGRCGCATGVNSFLKYVETATKAYVEEARGKKICKLHQKVELLKQSRRLEESYMTMEELLADREAEGKAEG